MHNIILIVSVGFLCGMIGAVIGYIYGHIDQASGQDKAVPADNKPVSRSIDVDTSKEQNKSDIGGMIDQLRKDRKDKPIYLQEGVIPDKTKRRLTENEMH